MSATSVVEKATSDMLIGPDWALNLDLCDAINNDPSQAKEIVKAVKKRLTNRSPQVQLLALTVLETLIKNCGDNVHQQVAEKDVLHELVKLVKKKADMRVRDKTLVLLDSWQEAFGGAGGRYPQYYMAYNDLQKAGVEFPRREGEPSVPIFTPPQSQPISSPRPPPHGPWSSAPPPTGPEDTDNVSGMGLADIKNSQNLAELCNDMVSALNPRDRMSAKEEVIVEIVDQCRINQRRVMQLVNDTSDEELLRQGLSLNDDLQRVLARYDAFLSGAPIPETPTESRIQPQKALLEDPPLSSPKVTQTQPEAQSSPQGAGSSTRPKGSARTIFPTLAPPPSSKRPVLQSSNVVASRPGDATIDLLSGDLPPSSQSEANSSSSLAVTAVDQPQKKQQVDFLALPAPEDDFNPFDSTPFQATPHTEAVSPVYPTQSFKQQTETPVLRPENSWSPTTTVTGTQRQQSSFYGEVQTQPTESVSGQPVEAQQQYFYPQSQPVTATPPPWQEDTQAPQPDQQWQGSPRASYPSWSGGNTTQMWNSGQQPAVGGMEQQYSGTGYAGISSQSSLGPPVQSTHQARVSSDLSRLGSGGTGPGDNFGSQYLLQRGSAYGQSSPLGTAPQPGNSKPAAVSKQALKSPDTLFHDLVDLRSVNAKFKAASLANKTPNTSKAGP
ncbi:hypothetical protein M758_3G070000 [Ceratodon purpureus]|uniref:TOM1-like protein 2 n=1 Tax=Ceratodon purpureus TaxID=3225 RepID=A0A8T0IFQ6_CERPU|nr:hypothetical protein KC19_3G069600 [Ceratodon purpureus]KAG0622075.1 hypothetical protein M758_3G070000 [Ceratodon purpureus]